MLYPPPVQCLKNFIGHKSETDRPKPKKKKVILDNIGWVTFLPILRSGQMTKIYPMLDLIRHNFLTSLFEALMICPEMATQGEILKNH